MLDTWNSAEALVRIAAALESGRLPPVGDRAFLACAIRRWLQEDEPIDRALGLGGGQGLRKARTTYLRECRNAALRKAHTLVDGPSAWQRSVALAAEVRHFNASIWPCWGGLDEPPTGFSDLRAALFEAANLGALPETPEGLHRICGPFAHDL